jgi:hypothetical protein
MRAIEYPTVERRWWWVRTVLPWLVLVVALAKVASAEPRAAEGAAAPASAAPAGVPDVDAWLAQLVSTDASARRSAAGVVESASSPLVPGIAKRLADLKRTANRDAMASVLARARKGVGADEERPKKPGSDESAKFYDWFNRVMATASPQDDAWRDLASILGMSRALAHIGSAPAVRELLGIYAGFGELIRVDVERQVKVLGERAVAPLIEMRRGEAKNLRPWASKMLDVLGKTVPGEAVQTADNQVLADVLRAYGRTKDTDAARVIVSFANSDRTQVREAAREAVTMLAENGTWQLRESYENLVGKKAPEDWPWDKVASELFAAYDKSRLSEAYALMDEGLGDYKNGKLEAMGNAFDRVLARAPGFERRREMIPGYLDLAHALRSSDRPRAMATLRKVVRLDPSNPRARSAESELAYLEALDLASRGVVDETAYRRAVELDPNNVEAKDALDRIHATSEGRSSAYLRYGLAAILALAAVIGAVVAMLWRAPRLAHAGRK